MAYSNRSYSRASVAESRLKVFPSVPSLTAGVAVGLVDSLTFPADFHVGEASVEGAKLSQFTSSNRDLIALKVISIPMDSCKKM